MPVFEDPIKRIERLLSKQEPFLAASFLRMVRQIESSFTLSEIANLLERNELLSAFDEALKTSALLGQSYSAAFFVAANDTARFLNQTLEEVFVVFDQTNYGAVNAMSRNQLRLVRGFSEIQRETTRLAITEGIASGENPRDMARRFRRSIGLTPRQYRAVENYRKALQTLSPEALSRMLRDRRFDPAIARAMRTEDPLTPQQIDKMTNRYRDRYVKYRSEVIARTEAQRSVNEGVRNMYEQAIEAGELDAQDLTQEWNTALDERVRSSHAKMHGQIRAFGVPFTSGLGNALRFPCDPEAPAADAIQCRCAVGTRMSLLPKATLT